MGRMTSNGKFRFLGLVVISGALLFSFQNCGKAGFDSNLGADAQSSTDANLVNKYGETVGAKVSSIPFAFETSIDTITHISCGGTHLKGRSEYSSLQIGAFASKGIRVSDAYFDYINQNLFYPEYPATQMSLKQFKEFLADSPQNAGVFPTLSVRSKASLAGVYPFSGATTSLTSTDVVPLANSLTDPFVMDSYSFQPGGSFARYFPFAQDQTLSARFSFNDNEATAEGMRTRFNSQVPDDSAAPYRLVLGYSKANSQIGELLGMSANNQAANGKSYSLLFSTKSGTINGNSPFRVLAEVVESDLDNQSFGSVAWDCNRVYTIVRSKDAALYCPPMTYSEYQDANNRAELSIIRRQLRADHWEVNVGRRCIVPKTGVDCYRSDEYVPSTTTPIPVVYDTSTICRRGDGADQDSAATTVVPYCPHFATVCIKN